jgi:hypothetical protein
MKIKTLALTVFFAAASVSFSLAQKKNQAAVDGIFAGKIGVGTKTGGIYSADELERSDWTIHTADPNYTVTEFKLSLVFKPNASAPYAEFEIKGNVIPVPYREKILRQAKAAYLEFIKAVNDRGVLVNINPIAIRIQE